MLDASWGYTYPEALKVGLAIEELGYDWYEDPLAPDDIYGYTSTTSTSAAVPRHRDPPGACGRCRRRSPRRQPTRSAATS